MKKNSTKITLNKQTITNLTNGEMKVVNAGEHDACWENIYTLYHCDVMWTGE